MYIVSIVKANQKKADPVTNNYNEIAAITIVVMIVVIIGIGMDAFPRDDVSSFKKYLKGDKQNEL